MQTFFVGATAYISSIEDSDAIFPDKWPIVGLQELTPFISRDFKVNRNQESIRGTKRIRVL
jgi:hypothetical protein